MQFTHDKLFNILFIFFNYILIKLNFYKFSSYLTYKYLKLLYIKDNNNNKIIISINNSNFRNDINILNEEFSILQFPDGLFNSIFQFFIPKRLSNLYDHQFCNKKSTIIKKYRQKLKDYYITLLKLIIDNHDIKFIVSPHFRYKNQQDFVDACKALSIIHICIYKETLSINSSKQIKSYIRKYQKFKKINVDYIIVSSDKVFKMISKMKIVENTKIKKFGLLRFELLNKIKLNKLKNKIILLSFGGITPFCSDIKICRNILSETIDTFIEVANNFKDLDFVIRCKPNNYLQNKQIFKDKDSVYNNIYLNYRSDLYSIFKSTFAVIGIHSTALLEAEILKIKPMIFIPKKFKNSKYYSEFYFKKNKVFDFYFSSKQIIDEIKKIRSDGYDGIGNFENLFVKEVSYYKNIKKKYKDFFKPF